MAARIGQKAPYWEAQAFVPGQDKFAPVNVKSTDYDGKWLVLFFYPLDFTFVCPTEIKSYSESYDKFRELGAEVLGASTDSVFSHKAWSDKGDLGQLKFPLLADGNQELSRKFGVLVEEKGIALRGTFIIDPEGKLRYSCVHDLGIGRSVDETVRVLQALQTGELCPVGWKPGAKTLGKA